MRPTLIIALVQAMLAFVQGSSPLELSITDLVLPKVTVTVKNADPQRTLGVWSTGTSWVDPAWCLEFRDREGKISVSHCDQGIYFRNFPRIGLLKPCERRTVTFDLSRHWSLPNNLPYAMPEGMSIRCVLHQRLEVDGHLGGLFTGRVTSPWFGGKHDAEVGACVEWHPLPAKSKGETFDLPGLFKRLDTLQEPKSPSPLLDWFGADADWNQVVIIHERPGAMLYPKLMLLFDNASALLLNYPAANRALDSVPFSNESSLKSSEDSERPQPNWALASDRLPRLSASGIDQITFLSGSNEATPRTFISWARQANGSYLRLNDETRTKPAK